MYSCHVDIRLLCLQIPCPVCAIGPLWLLFAITVSLVWHQLVLAHVSWSIPWISCACFHSGFSFWFLHEKFASLSSSPKVLLTHKVASLVEWCALPRFCRSQSLLVWFSCSGSHEDFPRSRFLRPKSVLPGPIERPFPAVLRAVAAFSKFQESGNHTQSSKSHSHGGIVRQKGQVRRPSPQARWAPHLVPFLSRLAEFTLRPTFCNNGSFPRRFPMVPTLWLAFSLVKRVWLLLGRTHSGSFLWFRCCKSSLVLLANCLFPVPSPFWWLYLFTLGRHCVAQNKIFFPLLFCVFIDSLAVALRSAISGVLPRCLWLLPSRLPCRWPRRRACLGCSLAILRCRSRKISHDGSFGRRTPPPTVDFLCSHGDHLCHQANFVSKVRTPALCCSMETVMKRHFVHVHSQDLRSYQVCVSCFCCLQMTPGHWTKDLVTVELSFSRWLPRASRTRTNKAEGAFVSILHVRATVALKFCSISVNLTVNPWSAVVVCESLGHPTCKSENLHDLLFDMSKLWTESTKFFLSCDARTEAKPVPSRNPSVLWDTYNNNARVRHEAKGQKTKTKKMRCRHLDQEIRKGNLWNTWSDTATMFIWTETSLEQKWLQTSCHDVLDVKWKVLDFPFWSLHSFLPLVQTSHPSPKSKGGFSPSVSTSWSCSPQELLELTVISAHGCFSAPQAERTSRPSKCNSKYVLSTWWNAPPITMHLAEFLPGVSVAWSCWLCGKNFRGFPRLWHWDAPVHLDHRNWHFFKSQQDFLMDCFLPTASTVLPFSLFRFSLLSFSLQPTLLAVDWMSSRSLSRFKFSASRLCINCQLLVTSVLARPRSLPQLSMYSRGTLHRLCPAYFKNFRLVQLPRFFLTSSMKHLPHLPFLSFPGKLFTPKTMRSCTPAPAHHARLGTSQLKLRVARHPQTTTGPPQADDHVM